MKWRQIAPFRVGQGKGGLCCRELLVSDYVEQKRINPLIAMTTAIVLSLPASFNTDANVKDGEVCRQKLERSYVKRTRICLPKGSGESCELRLDKIASFSLRKLVPWSVSES